MDKKSTLLIKSAISSVLVMSLTGTAQAIKTPEEIEATKKRELAAGNEKCAGRVLAGLNDCPTSQHACAGMGHEDNDPEEFIWMPVGTCERLVGTHVIHAAEKKEVASEEKTKDKKS